MAKKIEITQEMLTNVQKLYNDGLSAAKIAIETGYTVNTVQNIYKILNLKTINQKQQDTKQIKNDQKLCLSCNEYKNLDCFGSRKLKRPPYISYEANCNNCDNAKQRKPYHLKKKHKFNYSEKFLNAVMELFNEGFGALRISKMLAQSMNNPNINHQIVKRAYKHLGIHKSDKTVGKTNPGYKSTAIEKTCLICGITRPLNECKKEIKKNGGVSHRCILCRKNNIAKNLKQRMKTDVNFRLRKTISTLINHALKSNGSSKNGLSCLKFLQYTISDLKQHLENQFEDWMNWNNHGIYIKTEYDPNNKKTWKWQIDHIIPQEDFKYISMEDQAFKDCWALSNLRPYCAKQNQEDGATRIRHNIKYK